MKNIESIAHKLATIWHKVYVVGSYNVYTILGRDTTSDIDLTTPAKPEEMRKVLNVVGEIGAKYGTLIVKEWWEIYEITTFRRDIGSLNQRRPEEVIYTDSMVEDAGRRDFTCNAIYYEPLKKEYVDPVWWLNDLRNWIIRFVWDANKRLDEDILRLLRYIRLKNKYWFNSIDNSYEVLLSERVTELASISWERIKQELDKILLDNTNTKALEDLKKYWFFREFFPSIDMLALTPWGKVIHQEGNVWVHTLLVIEQLNYLNCQDIDIYWTALLHDIGKYPTHSYDEQGNIHYYKHAEIWAEMFSDSIVTELPFSNKSQWKIKWLIKNHIRIASIEDMRKLKQYEFMMHSYFSDLIILYTADNLGKIPTDKNSYVRLNNLYSAFQERLKTITFLTWNDIMRMYPNLEWREIWMRLKLENNRILENIEI